MYPNALLYDHKIFSFEIKIISQCQYYHKHQNIKTLTHFFFLSGCCLLLFSRVWEDVLPLPYPEALYIGPHWVGLTKRDRTILGSWDALLSSWTLIQSPRVHSIVFMTIIPSRTIFLFLLLNLLTSRCVFSPIL